MKLKEEIRNLLNDRESTKVLTSVSEDGIPHTVVIGSTMSPVSDMICAAEVYMKRTGENLMANPNAAVLAVKGNTSYQITVRVKAHQTKGELFDNIKSELDKAGMPCRGIWVFEPLEAFDQSASPMPADSPVE